MPEENDMKLLPEQLAILSLGALMIAPIIAAPVMWGQPAEHRLIGFACGPDRVTMTAVEEDHFPAPCDAIEAVADVCPETPTDAVMCLDYMGRDGW
jgi:hypothetical protein